MAKKEKNPLEIDADGHNPFNPIKSGVMIEVLGSEDCQEAQEMFRNEQILKLPTLSRLCDVPNISGLQEEKVGVIVHRRERLHRKASQSSDEEPIAKNKMGVVCNGTVYILSICRKEQSNFAEFKRKWCIDKEEIVDDSSDSELLLSTESQDLED